MGRENGEGGEGGEGGVEGKWVFTDAAPASGSADMYLRVQSEPSLRYTKVAPVVEKREAEIDGGALKLHMWL